MEEQEEKMNTVKEAAARLRVTPRTVKKMIGRGDLNAMKIGPQWRIAESELVAVMRSTIKV